VNFAAGNDAASPDLRSGLTDLTLNVTEGDWGRVRTKAEVETVLRRPGGHPARPGGHGQLAARRDR
jgi:hypothetical protein